MAPDGSPAPCQWRTLTTWPGTDRPRWVQLDFQTAHAGEHTATWREGAGGAQPNVHRPVTAVCEDDAWRVTVGRLGMTVDPQARSPLTLITWDGETLADSDILHLEAVDGQGETAALAVGAATDVRVEASGPLRFQLAWETRHQTDDGRPTLDARIRLTWLAGVEGVRLSYQFFHRIPGTPSWTLRRLSAELDLPGFDVTHGGRGVFVQSAWSDLWLRRFVRSASETRVRVDDTRTSPWVEEEHMLDDDAEYPWFLDGDHRDVEPVIALERDGLSMRVVAQDMVNLRPTGLRFEPGFVGLDIWPEWAEPTRLPSGRSRRQVVDLLFADASGDALEPLMLGAGADEGAPLTGWLSPASSASAGASWDGPRTLAADAPRAGFFSKLLADGAARWIPAAGMFDFGDVPDPGYPYGYSAMGRAPQDPDYPSRYTFAMDGGIHHTFHAARDLHEVWTNNEYDAIYCLALEAIRTRSDKTLRKLIAAARHQIEVDFVHYDDHWQHHRTTPPHSWDHITGTGALASHQWTQGLYHYHALAGDDDVPDVVRGICDFNLLYLQREDISSVNFFNRELGWALIALVYGYEMLGEAKYLDAAREVIDRLKATADRTNFDAEERKAASVRGLNASGIGIGFNVNTAPLGLKCYHQVTGDPEVLDLLIQWCDAGLVNFTNPIHGVTLSELFPETLAYVTEVTGERKYLDAVRWHLLMFFRGFNTLGWIGGQAVNPPPLSTKSFCRIYRALSPTFTGLAARDELGAIEDRLLGGPLD